MPSGGTPTPTASGLAMPVVPPWALSLQSGGRRASSGFLVAASHNGADSSLLSLPDLSTRAQSGSVKASTSLSKVTNFPPDEDESLAATPNDAADLQGSEHDEIDDTDAVITEGNSPEPARIMSDVLMMSLAQDGAADPEARTQGQSEHTGAIESYASNSKMQALEGIWRKQHVLDEAAQQYTVDTAAGAHANKRRRVSISSDSSGSDIPAFLPKQTNGTGANGDRTAPSKHSTSDAEIPSPKRIKLGELNGRARLTEEDLQTALRANENRAQSLDHAGLAGSPQHDFRSSRAVSSTTAARRPAPKASVLDQSDDDSELSYESDQEDHEDIEKATPNTQTNKLVSTPSFSPNPNDAPEPLLTTTDGRLYSTLPDGTSKTNGSVFPTGYRLSDDPEYPYICAARDCQRLLPNVLSLGAHLGAKHCRQMFNDNLDGTMTFLGTYTKNSRSSSAPPIIVSRNPPRPDEPGPVLAMVPAYVRKRVEDQKLVAVNQAKKHQGGRSKKHNARLRDLAEQSRPSMVVTMKVPSKSASATPSASGNDRNDDLYQYLMNKLPSNTVLMTSGKVDELLQLPRLRSFPQGWKPLTMQRGLERISLTALLVYLTGDELTSGGCTHCYRVPGRACIVPHAGASKELRKSLKNGCAFCFYEAYCLHRRSWCSLLPNPGPDTRDPEQSSLAVQDTNSAVPGETMDSADLTHDAGARPARRAAIEAKAAINAGASSQMLLSAGNVIPGNILEMEEWEIAPGRIRDNTGPVGENIAFSNSFVASTQEIPISSDVSFNVLTIKPGGSVQFQGHIGKLRVCSVAAGKLQVKMGPHDFAIGPNGMFKVPSGESAVITNRLYLDSVLHVSSVKEY